MGDANREEIQEMREAIGYLLEQVDRLNVFSEAAMTALSAVILSTRPQNEEQGREWMEKLRDLSIATVEMRAAAVQAANKAAGQTDPRRWLSATSTAKRPWISLNEYFDDIAGGAKQ